VPAQARGGQEKVLLAAIQEEAGAAVWLDPGEAGVLDEGPGLPGWRAAAEKLARRLVALAGPLAGLVPGGCELQFQLTVACRPAGAPGAGAPGAGAPGAGAPARKGLPALAYRVERGEAIP